jgi:hypothetical protein
MTFVLHFTEDVPARFSILVSQNFPWFEIFYNKVSGEKMGNLPGTSSVKELQKCAAIYFMENGSALLAL